MQSIREPSCLSAVQPKIVTPNYLPFVSLFLSVMPRPPIGKGDIPVKLAGHDKRLPTIYETSNHPKYNGPGRIFYFIQDLSKSALRRVARLEKSLKVPHGSHQTAVEKGEFIYTN